jgi:hypothetical protein
MTMPRMSHVPALAVDQARSAGSCRLLLAPPPPLSAEGGRAQEPLWGISIRRDVRGETTWTLVCFAQTQAEAEALVRRCSVRYPGMYRCQEMRHAP